MVLINKIGQGEDKYLTPQVVPTARVAKVLIDGFEHPNPNRFYTILEGDDSIIDLDSSRLVVQGDYSMAIKYSLITTKPWGSWITVRWRDEETPLDWSGTKEIKIWVKGDGSDNIFELGLLDADNETWVYQARHLLQKTNWELLTIPIDELVLSKQSFQYNKKLDLNKIKEIQFTVLGKYGDQLVIPKKGVGEKTYRKTGKIWLDQFYIVGENINPIWAAPKEIPKKAVTIGEKKIDFSGRLNTEYFYAPELRHELNHQEQLAVNGKVGLLSARMDLAAEKQNFSDAAYLSTSSTSTTVTTAFPSVNISNLQFEANNLNPYLNNLTLGNIYVDYSEFTFSPMKHAEFTNFPIEGFKGLSGEGDILPLNYNLFFIKQPYDSFSAGSRLVFYDQNFRLRAIAVKTEDSAKIDESTVGSGSLSPDGALHTRKLADDYVYTVDGTQRLFDQKVSLDGLYGYNTFKRSATADLTDPFHPVFNTELTSPVSEGSKIWRLGLELDDLLWTGTRINYSYRDVGTDFKPRFRQEPESFDDVQGDQRGHNLAAYQWLANWVVSGQYDGIRRNSNRAYYRHRSNWGLGYYGSNGLDVSVTQEYRREIYRFTSDRSAFSTDRNEKVVISELLVRNELIKDYVTTASGVIVTFKLRREAMEHPLTGLSFQNNSFSLKLEYALRGDTKLNAEYKTTHFGRPEFEPQGYPYDDNFARVGLQLTF
ncbi:MAG: CIA30 family protein [Elusimicrobiota bacterium]